MCAYASVILFCPVKLEMTRDVQMIQTYLVCHRQWQLSPRKTEVCLETSPCPASLLSSEQRWCPWSSPSRPGWRTVGTKSYLCLWGSPEHHWLSEITRQIKLNRKTARCDGHHIAVLETFQVLDYASMSKHLAVWRKISLLTGRNL